MLYSTCQDCAKKAQERKKKPKPSWERPPKKKEYIQ